MKNIVNKFWILLIALGMIISSCSNERQYANADELMQ